MDKWFTELHGLNASDDIGLTFRIKEILYSKKSAFQKIEVYQTYGAGKMLVLDNAIMFTELNEFSYHEMITHVPMMAHPFPENILIVGGGDGGVLREVVKHLGVRTLELVEIDKMVVEVSKRFFPEVAKGFDSPLAKIYFEDAVKFISKTKKEFYDIIIVDSTDPVGAAKPLFEVDFMQKVKVAMKEKGIGSMQIGSPFFDEKNIVSILNNLKEVFSIVMIYVASIPFYPGGLWSFAFFSNSIDPFTFFREKDCLKMEDAFKYYNYEIHKASFMLPSFVKRYIK